MPALTCLSPRWTLSLSLSTLAEFRPLLSLAVICALSRRKAVPPSEPTASSEDIVLKPGLLPTSVASFCQDVISVSCCILRNVQWHEETVSKGNFFLGSRDLILSTNKAGPAQDREAVFWALADALSIVLSWPDVSSDFSHLVIKRIMWTCRLQSHITL